MSVPARLADLLSGSLEGVTRIALRHERMSAFRWLSLVELPIKLTVIVVGMLCLAIVFVVAWILAEDSGDFFPELDADDGDGCSGCISPRVRFFNHWQELVFTAQDKDGNTISEVRHRPRNRTEGEAIVSAILAAADRECLVVAETLGSEAREALTLWCGGQPLMAHPRQSDPEQVKSRLELHGFGVREEDGLAELRLEEAAVSRFRGWCAFLLRLLISPLFFWSRPFREALKHSWWDARGVPPMVWTLSIHANQLIEERRERAGSETVDTRVDGRDLLGMTSSATLDYDLNISRLPSSLRLVCRHQTHTIGKHSPPWGTRYEVQEWMTLQALRLWTGAPQTTLRPTCCPYCGTHYPFQVDPRCPSCGAPPGAR